MVKGPVNSFIKQIEHRNKSPEKSTPSPHVYDNMKSWHKKSQAGRTTHTIKFAEQRTTFMQVQETHANDTPAAKYNILEPVSSFKI